MMHKAQVLCAEHDGMGEDKLAMLLCCQEEQNGVHLVVESELARMVET